MKKAKFRVGQVVYIRGGSPVKIEHTYFDGEVWYYRTHVDPMNGLHPWMETELREQTAREMGPNWTRKEGANEPTG